MIKIFRTVQNIIIFCLLSVATLTADQQDVQRGHQQVTTPLVYDSKLNVEPPERKSERSIILECANQQRVEEKKQNLAERIARARKRRLILYGTLGVTGVALLGSWLLGYFSDNQANLPDGGGVINQNGESLDDLWRRRYLEESTPWGMFKKYFMMGITLTAASAISGLVLDGISWSSGFSWSKIKQIFGENELTNFLQTCVYVDNSSKRVERSFPAFVKNLEFLRDLHGEDESEPNYKEFLYAALQVDFRAFVDALEDVIALALYAQDNLEEHDTARRETLNKVIGQTIDLIDESASLFEYTINHMDVVARKKKAVFKAYTFSKKIEATTFQIITSLGRTLHGERFGLR